MNKIITTTLAALVAFTVSAYAMAVQYPCQGEDDSNCFYDARIGGNGYGWSFVDIAGHAVYLWEVKP